MPLQNRVTPTGEIVAVPERGTFMGNRGGRLHTPDKRLTGRRWTSRAWITCRLAFRGRQRSVMSPNSYTELFFLDEATSMAAGHRPCAECRRADFNRFMTLWAEIRGRTGRAYVKEVDTVLHGERVGPERGQRRHRSPIAELPDGTFVLHEDRPCLLRGTKLLAWSPVGYLDAVTRPGRGSTDVLTPKSVVELLGAGYRPAIHPSAGPSASR